MVTNFREIIPLKTMKKKNVRLIFDGEVEESEEGRLMRLGRVVNSEHRDE